LIRWKPPTSVHTRLTLWYTGVLLIILLVISGFSYWLLALALTRDVDPVLLELAEVVRESVTSGRGGSGASEAVAELDAGFRDQLVQVVDVEGVPTYLAARLKGQPLPLSAVARENALKGKPTFETLHFGPRQMRLVTLPVLHKGRPPAEIVQVAGSLARSHRAARRYLETLVILIPLGLGLAATGGALMARKALEPVDRMSRSARRITAEDLSRRLDLRGTGDELDRLADTLNEMLGRLEGAFGAMRRFSADAAHELRTPLTALKGGLEVALRAERSPEEYRQVLAAKLEEVDRLIRLAEDLLIVGRSGADLATARAPVDLDQVALEVLDVGARLAQPRGVTVRMEVADPVTVLGDASALHRAARNLIENAVNYTPAGGLVELNVARENGTGLLSVRDTGPGIAPGDVTRVFEPFVRLDAARDRASGGAGLGLSIARSIVAAHGGEITLETSVGHGSRFTIRLPAVG
jgi:heavy metal sensor kinase